MGRPFWTVGPRASTADQRTQQLKLVEVSAWSHSENGPAPPRGLGCRNKESAIPGQSISQGHRYGRYTIAREIQGIRRCLRPWAKRRTLLATGNAETYRRSNYPPYSRGRTSTARGIGHGRLSSFRAPIFGKIASIGRTRKRFQGQIDRNSKVLACIAVGWIGKKIKGN